MIATAANPCDAMDTKRHAHTFVFACAYDGPIGNTPGGFHRASLPHERGEERLHRPIRTGLTRALTQRILLVRPLDGQVTSTSARVIA